MIRIDKNNGKQMRKLKSSGRNSQFSILNSQFSINRTSQLIRLLNSQFSINRTSQLIELLFLLVPLCVISCKPKDCNAKEEIPNKKYDLFNTAKSCTIFYDYNEDKSEINLYSDTIFLNRSKKMYFTNFSLYLEEAEIIHFVDVLAFENIVYMQVEDREYLYIYPAILASGETDEDGNDQGQLVWEDCGVFVEFNEYNMWEVTLNVALFDPTEYCRIPKREKSNYETPVETKIIKYTN